MTSFDNFAQLFMEKATSTMEKAKFCLRCWEHTEVQSFQPESALTPILGLNWE